MNPLDWTKKGWKIFCWFFLARLAAEPVLAASAELQPGDVIGPNNWQRVQGMVGENFLNRIKQGYTFKIKQARLIGPPLEYTAATSKYSGQVKLNSNGDLLNYVAGLPFGSIDPKDPQAGQKLAWNFYWRWLGDDVREGGGTKTGKIIRDVVETDGAERRADIIHHFIKTRGRVTIEPRPTIPGYEHIDWMQMRVDEYPRDTSGTTTLEVRYVDPNREDDLYIYVPSIRRVRRVPPLQRCGTLAPSEFNFDDIKSFNGKVTDFNYKFLGEKRVRQLFPVTESVSSKAGGLSAARRGMGTSRRLRLGDHSQSCELLLSEKDSLSGQEL